MRRLQRTALCDKTTRVLADCTAKVAKASDPAMKAKRLWDARAKASARKIAFEEIRRELKAMSRGLERCMYCEDSAGTDIEHFWPKSFYPHRAFVWTNYLWACGHCNSNFKRAQFPLDTSGQPLLIDPSAEDPQLHLTLSPRTGKLTPASPKGQQSIEVFGLNEREPLVKGRYNAWVALQGLIVEFARHKSGDLLDEAARIETVVREYPFAGVLAALLRIVTSPGAVLVSADCLEAIEAFPEIRGWA